jgi:hypothetical protein
MRGPILGLFCLAVGGLVIQAAPFQKLGFRAADTNLEEPASPEPLFGL